MGDGRITIVGRETPPTIAGDAPAISVMRSSVWWHSYWKNKKINGGKMSALYFKIYIRPNGEGGMKSLQSFLMCVETKDFDKIKAMNCSDKLQDIDYYLSEPIDTKIEDDILFMAFDTFTSFDENAFVKFLMENGAEELEAEVENTGSNYTSYFLGADLYEDYDQAKWRWLPEPYCFSLWKKNIVVLGKKSDATQNCIDDFKDYFQATFSCAIDSESDLVVACEDSDLAVLELAKSKGIRVISEKHFRDLG